MENSVKVFREQFFEELLKQSNSYIWHNASLKDVRQAVIILSSSRSGSSFLVSVLRKLPEFYSLSGEDSPFFKLHVPNSGKCPSDAISEQVLEKENHTTLLSREFLNDFSIEGNPDAIMKDMEVLAEYVNDLMLRIPLQWPQIAFSYEPLKRTIKQAFCAYKKAHTQFSVEDFYLELLFLLRLKYKVINPYYYDISPKKIGAKFPTLAIPSSPPCKTLSIEEPPFILLSPRQKVQKSDLAEKFLLLKTPADCYRLPLIESLLPQANIKFIYLTRNPAASINGIYDGWLHRGFFSYNLKPFLLGKNTLKLKALNISGYSDKFSWGKWWWKYDLPPDWQDYTQRSLEEVCAFQWKSAHQYIQKYLTQRKKKFLFVAYEDLIMSPESRVQALRKILEFANIDPLSLNKIELNELPLIQATQMPKFYRWKEREKLLLPLLKNPELGRICSSLGYRLKKMEEWI